MVLTTANGHTIFPIGAGTWQIGNNKDKQLAEIEALNYGMNHDLNLIDTAEMYGNGASERLIHLASKLQIREDLFLVSKVLPENANRSGIKQSLDKSLRRLETDYLDLYLLHWKSSYSIEETIEGFEEAKKVGKIRHWGVSNFDTDDLKELVALPLGKHCSVNQIKYNIVDRGAEFELLPYMKQQQITLMAYSPLYKGRFSQFIFEQEKILKIIALNHQATISQILLAWSIRAEGTFSIPKAGSVTHMKENIESAQIILTNSELEAIDNTFSPPLSKSPLALW